MKKEDINLLPLSIRQDRLARLQMHRWRKVVRWFNVGFACMALGLGSYYYTLMQQPNTPTPDASLPAPSPTLDPVVKAQEIDSALTAIFQQTRSWPVAPWRISDALAAVPAGVTISEISQAEINSDIVLVGTAPSAEAVVAYKQQLMALPWVKNVTVPLGNFAGLNTQFTVSITPAI